MNIIQIVTILIILLGSILFFASAVTAFVGGEINRRMFFWNPIVLIITGFCYFLSVIGFLILVLYFDSTKSKNKPEYKLVTKPLYEQIK